MDPFTLLIIAAIGWWIRNVVEDAWAFARGETSPRIVRQRERQRLAQERIAVTGHPSVGQAIAGRVATRIADPPANGFPRPLREFLAERWADALADAIDKHRRRREERADRTDASSAKPLVAEPCAGGCGRYVVDPSKLCPVCGLAASQPGSEPEPESQPKEPHDDAPAEEGTPDRQPTPPEDGAARNTAPHPGSRHNLTGLPQARCANSCGRHVAAPGDVCWQCTVMQVPPSPGPSSWIAFCAAGCGRPAQAASDPFCLDCWACVQCRLFASPPGDSDRLCSSCRTKPIGQDDGPTETPESTPTPDPHQEGTPTMTAPAPQIISGDIGSPQEALAFCDANLQVNTAAAEGLDTVLNNLAGEGVGNDFLDIIGTALDTIESSTGPIDGARDVYIDHVRTQADLLADPDLRDTLIGYLDARTA